jgi:hypothetical protein
MGWLFCLRKFGTFPCSVVIVEPKIGQAVAAGLVAVALCFDWLVTQVLFFGRICSSAGTYVQQL